MPQLAIEKIKKYKQNIPIKGTSKSLEERERLITEYAPLVKTIAGRLAMRLPQHISQDDLVSAGIMGLLDAVDKYSPEKGVEFKSYAEFRIRGAMLDELRSMDWVPRSVRKNAKRVQEAYSNVEKVKMRPARDEEVAQELGIDMEDFYQLLNGTRGIAIISEDELGEIIPQTQSSGQWPSYQAMMGIGSDPFDSLNLTEVKSVIAEAIDNLPQKERIVVTLYYYEELTMKEIGEIMGYTESRVSQLHTKAALMLRNSLKSYFDTEKP
ncbi:sigma-70 family RNA polymerase sigma factor [Thermodesulfobacteriota bacterium]